MFFSGRPGVALMGASGFLTCIYAITKISYTYQIPLLFLITLRGAPGDDARYHVSNGLYLRPVIEAIDIPALYVEQFSTTCRRSRAPIGTHRSSRAPMWSHSGATC